MHLNFTTTGTTNTTETTKKHLEQMKHLPQELTCFMTQRTSTNYTIKKGRMEIPKINLIII